MTTDTINPNRMVKAIKKLRLIFEDRIIKCHLTSEGPVSSNGARQAVLIDVFVFS
jgi:hypothetical protein